MMFDDGLGWASPFDGFGLDDAEDWLEAEKAEQASRRAGSRKTAPTPNPKPQTPNPSASPSPSLLPLLDAHIARLWHALPAQSRRRLGVVAASTGVTVSPEAHAELLGALGLIAEAEGTLEAEAEFCEIYLTVPWVCSAIAEIEAERAAPAPKGEPAKKRAKRREQVRQAVARHRQKHKAAESSDDRKKREASERRMSLVSVQKAIAIDGEGMSLEDGSHVYRYMAACLGDGTVLGELSDEAGIGTAAALEFVTNLPKADENGIPYLGVFGYGLGYDITKWLERLANKPLFELFHSDDLKPKAKCGAIGLLLIGKCLELVDKRAPKGLRRTRVWDIIKGFQSTFVKALQAWQVGNREEVAFIELMKKQRGNHAQSDWNEVQRYCKDECRLLAMLVETYIRAHVEAGIDLRGKYHGAGSTSDAFLEKMNALEKRCTREVSSKDFDTFYQTKSAFSRAFFGGRAEVSRIGFVQGPYWTADIASAYPHVLYSLPCVRHGKWHHVTGRGLQRSLSAAKVAVVHYRMDAPGARDWGFVTPGRPELGELGAPADVDDEAKVKARRKKKAKKQKAIAEGLIEPETDDEVSELERGIGERALMTGILADVGKLPWGPLPYRTDKGSIVFPSSHPGGWAWKDEYEVAKKHFPDEVVASEAWVLKGHCQCERPYQAIGQFYLLRIAWGSDGRGKVLKLGYNGCYGKFAQVIGKNPKYSCRVVAGHITGATRARLFDAIMSAPDPWSVVYAATDGLISTVPLSPPNPPENETTATAGSKWLGVWEVSQPTAEDFFIVQPGFWFSTAPDGKVRTRGTPLEIIHAFRPAILEQWRREPTKKPRGLPKASTFHGIKTSIRPPTKEHSKYRRDPLYGRWTSDHRRIAYVVNPKRSGLIDQGDGSYRLTGWWMRPENPESAEYKKDPSFAAKDAINDEQPDFVESLSEAVGD